MKRLASYRAVGLGFRSTCEDAASEAQERGDQPWSMVPLTGIREEKPADDTEHHQKSGEG
jgi:hypothetical protein